MAADTLAQVFSLTFYGLGAPKNLDLNSVKRAVHEEAAFYWTDLIQSDQNQVTKVSDAIAFDLNTVLYSLESLSDMVMPDWVEIQVGSDTVQDWRLVPVVNRDSLPSFRDRGELVCSFYSDLQIKNNTIVTLIEFSFPYGNGSTYDNFRVWYDPTVSLSNNPDEATGLPIEYNYMLACRARMKLIPECIGLAIQDAKENKTDKFILEAELNSWDTKLKLEAADAARWDAKWKFFKNASRTSQGGGRKRPIIPYYL
jgi:hypothetical protein